MVQQKLPGRILQQGSVCLRHLGETVSSAMGLLQEWQRSDRGAKRGGGVQRPAVEIYENDERNNDDHQKPAYVAK